MKLSFLALLACCGILTGCSTFDGWCGDSCCYNSCCNTPVSTCTSCYTKTCTSCYANTCSSCFTCSERYGYGNAY